VPIGESAHGDQLFSTVKAGDLQDIARAHESMGLCRLVVHEDAAQRARILGL
jgi:hypothetical protein